MRRRIRKGSSADQNILYVAQSIDDVAARTGARPMTSWPCSRVRDSCCSTSVNGRPRPHRDDKIITAWNGLMIAAFARAARVLVGSPRRGEWLDHAERAAAFVRDAALGRRRRGVCCAATVTATPRIDAFCEDYAYLVWGLLELFQATGEARLARLGS